MEFDSNKINDILLQPSFSKQIDINRLSADDADKVNDETLSKLGDTVQKAITTKMSDERINSIGDETLIKLDWILQRDLIIRRLTSERIDKIDNQFLLQFEMDSQSFIVTKMSKDRADKIDDITLASLATDVTPVANALCVSGEISEWFKGAQTTVIEKMSKSRIDKINDSTLAKLYFKSQIVTIKKMSDERLMQVYKNILLRLHPTAQSIAKERVVQISIENLRSKGNKQECLAALNKIPAEILACINIGTLVKFSEPIRNRIIEVVDNYENKISKYEKPKPAMEHVPTANKHEHT